MNQIVKRLGALCVLLTLLMLAGCPNPAGNSSRYTVSFNTDGGTAVAPILNVVSGAKITKPTPDPTKDGYTFSGWYKEEGTVNPWNFENDTVTADTTLYAKWESSQEQTGSLTLETAAGGSIKAYLDNSHTTEITDFAGLAVGTTVYLKATPDNTELLEVTDIRGIDTSSYTKESDGSVSAEVTVAEDTKTITPAFGTIGLGIEGGSVTGYTGESTTLIIPSSKNGVDVTTIGEYAFYDCSGLETVTIPSSVTTIWDGAFDGCTSLSSYSVAAANTHYSAQDGILFSADKTTLVAYPAGKTNLSVYTIPEGVTSIGDLAFSYCSALTTVTIPSSVTSIGDGAFANCSSLTGITIPEGVTTIGGGAFSGCSMLETVTIKEGVTSIGDGAFIGCSMLKDVTIPEGVTSIGDRAFSGCSMLETVTIPEGVTSIGDEAFYACSMLKDVTIPEGVTSIGAWAFQDCSALTTVTIPSSVTSIGDQAFAFCSSLETVTIPSSVISIGEYAFSDCTVLSSVRVEATDPPTLGINAFDNCPALPGITVPTGSLNAYMLADGWKDLPIPITEASDAKTP